jgi:hypothetical protein
VLEDFIRAIRENTVPSTDGREARRSVELVEMIYAAARRTSRWVAGVPEVSGAAPQTLAEIRRHGLRDAASPRWPSSSASGTRRSAFHCSSTCRWATHRWIVASGDPDFWLDADTFRAAGAVMALLAFGLGIFTIRAAGHTFISRYEPRRHWLR